MNLINKIENREELISTRDHFGNVLKEHLSLNLKMGKLEQITSYLLGSSDFNTAMAQANKRNRPRITVDDLKDRKRYGVMADIRGIEDTCGDLVVEYLSTKINQDELLELCPEMDQLVWESIGTSKHISNTINNMGLEVQIQKLALVTGMPWVWDKLNHLLDIHVGPRIFMNWYNANKVCNKCGTTLDALGYCEDETCPYENWPQKVEESEIESLSTVDIELYYNIRKRIRVMATCYSDDRVYEAEFDATAYFSDAIKHGQIMQVIDALSGCGWGGDYPSDSIAEFFSDGGKGIGHEDVKNMYDHILNKNLAKAFDADNIGFEVHIDKDSIKSWIEFNYPAIYKNAEELLK